MNREPLLFHLMLKQGITWFTLAAGTQETVQTKLSNILSLKYFKILTIQTIFKMAYILQSKCNFLHGFFRYQLPVETVDVEVKITSVQGIHTFRRDRMCQIIKCNPWITRLHPHPTLIKKMRTYLKLEGKLGPKHKQQPQSQQNQSTPSQPSTNSLGRKGTKTNDKRRKLIPTKIYKV